MDPLRIIRIRSAINGALGQGSSATTALIELYTTAREQVGELLDDDLRAELESLCPPWTARRAGLVGSAVSGGVTAAEARARLQTLAGWLDGVLAGIEWESQIAANAQAYAAERVRQERGMGFRTGD